MNNLFKILLTIGLSLAGFKSCINRAMADESTNRATIQLTSISGVELKLTLTFDAENYSDLVESVDEVLNLLMVPKIEAPGLAPRDANKSVEL